jgi:hypothetical protein
MSVFLNDVRFLMKEDFNWQDIKTFVERKIKGYSSGEVDSIVNKLKTMDSEEKKRDLLARTEAAIKDANEAKSKTTDSDKLRELTLQLEILSTLKSKISAFNVIKHVENTAEEEKRRKEELENMKAQNTVKLSDR